MESKLFERRGARFGLVRGRATLHSVSGRAFIQCGHGDGTGWNSRGEW